MFELVPVWILAGTGKRAERNKASGTAQGWQFRNPGTFEHVGGIEVEGRWSFVCELARLLGGLSSVSSLSREKCHRPAGLRCWSLDPHERGSGSGPAQSSGEARSQVHSRMPICTEDVQRPSQSATWLVT